MNTIIMNPSAINNNPFNMAAADNHAPRQIAGKLLEIKRPVSL